MSSNAQINKYMHKIICKTHNQLNHSIVLTHDYVSPTKENRKIFQYPAVTA